MRPFAHLCETANLDQVRVALARGVDVNRKTKCKRTGLMEALTSGTPETRNKRLPVVRLLMEQPTLDLNCTDDDGNTALHLAAKAGNVQGVRMLLADPRLNSINKKNNEGCTAVMCVINVSMIASIMDVLRELLSSPNVDLDTTDQQGRSLEEVAR